MYVVMKKGMKSLAHNGKCITVFSAPTYGEAGYHLEFFRWGKSFEVRAGVHHEVCAGAGASVCMQA